jgi:hypothetical protein
MLSAQVVVAGFCGYHKKDTREGCCALHNTQDGMEIAERYWFLASDD